MTQTPKPPSLYQNFREDLSSIGTVGALVTIALGAVLSGFSGALQAFASGEANLAMIMALSLKTAPLTLFFALWGLALFRGWIRHMDSYQHFVFAILISGLAMALLTALFEELLPGTGINMKSLPTLDGFWGWLARQWSVLDFLIGAIRAYFHRYGMKLFASAIVLGLFFGWIVSNRIWPWFSKEKKATAP